MTAVPVPVAPPVSAPPVVTAKVAVPVAVPHPLLSRMLAAATGAIATLKRNVPAIPPQVISDVEAGKFTSNDIHAVVDQVLQLAELAISNPIELAIFKATVETTIRKFLPPLT